MKRGKESALVVVSHSTAATPARPRYDDPHRGPEPRHKSPTANDFLILYLSPLQNASSAGMLQGRKKASFQYRSEGNRGSRSPGGGGGGGRAVMGDCSMEGSRSTAATPPARYMWVNPPTRRPLGPEEEI